MISVGVCRVRVTNGRLQFENVENSHWGSDANKQLVLTANGRNDFSSRHFAGSFFLDLDFFSYILV